MAVLGQQTTKPVVANGSWPNRLLLCLFIAQERPTFVALALTLLAAERASLASQ